MATIMEILSKPIEERKQFYNVSTPSKRIDEVDIDGQKFSGYKAFSFLWAKSYHKEPIRSIDGTIENLNDNTSCITPRLKIDFSILSIDDYRRIMQLVYSKNEFTVTCYDVVNDRMTTNKMYFTTEEMPKLFLLNRALNGEEWIELLGIDGYTVEMIGTNADLDTVTVTYLNIDPVSGTFKETYSSEFYAKKEMIIGDNVPFKNKELYTNSKYYIFSGIWYEYVLNENGLWQKTNAQYRDNTAITINRNITLGIDYRSSETQPSFNVFLNYGLGEEKLDIYGNPILSISMKNNQLFSLYQYTTENPKVTFLSNTYYPYEFKGWYYTPVLAEGSTSLNGTPFDKSQDVTIYQLYEPREYTLSFNTNTPFQSDYYFSDVKAKYGETLAIAIPLNYKHKFVGWYFEPELKNKFNGTMPPFDATIYAKWEREDD